MLDAPVGEVEDIAGDDQRDDADGDVHVEDPAPGGVIGEEPTEQRTHNTGEPEGRTNVALVASTLPRRDDIADDRLRQHDQPATTDALQRPKGDELPHILGKPGECRADQKDHNRELKEMLPAV